MSQRQQLERLLIMDSQIRSGMFPNADRLAQELEVSRRVIFDDRKFLIERLGAPLAYDRCHGGWRYTDATWMLPTTMVSEGELLAFVLAVEGARRYAGTALEKPLLQALEKIAQSLHGPVGVDLQALRHHCSFGNPSMLAADEKTVLTLCRAVLDRHSVRMTYYTAETNTTRVRVVDPYHMHNVHGSWYLFAFDHDGQRVLTFHAGRVRSLEVLAQSFETVADFDATERIQTMLGAEAGDELLSVAIRFDDYQACFIRDREFHPSQQIEELVDGGIILRFQTSSWGEVTRFILQYGSHAEVLAPDELRDEIAREVQNMTRLYQREITPTRKKRHKRDKSEAKRGAKS